MKTRFAIAVSVVTVCLVSCTSQQPSASAKPEGNLIGKWEESATSKGHSLVQYEFLADGTVIRNEKLFGDGKWHQASTGTFKFITPTRLKMELQPSWAYGVSIYELVWKDQDQDHVGFRAGDETIQLSRVQH